MRGRDAPHSIEGSIGVSGSRIAPCAIGPAATTVPASIEAGGDGLIGHAAGGRERMLPAFEQFAGL